MRHEDQRIALRQRPHRVETGDHRADQDTGETGLGHELDETFEFLRPGAGVGEVEAPPTRGLVGPLHRLAASEHPGSKSGEVVGQVLIVLDQISTSPRESARYRGQLGDARAPGLYRRGQQRTPEHTAKPPHPFDTVVRSREALEERPGWLQIDQSHAAVHRGVADSHAQQAEEIRREIRRVADGDSGGARCARSVRIGRHRLDLPDDFVLNPSGWNQRLRNLYRLLDGDGAGELLRVPGVGLKSVDGGYAIGIGRRLPGV